MAESWTEHCIYCGEDGETKHMTFIGGGYGHPVCHMRAVAEARAMTREDWEAEYAAQALYYAEADRDDKGNLL